MINKLGIINTFWMSIKAFKKTNLISVLCNIQHGAFTKVDKLKLSQKLIKKIENFQENLEKLSHSVFHF